MTREIAGLSGIISAFDAIIVDQYGVLHDGERAFPGAVETLSALKARDIPVAALTNSGKRARTNAARLARLGFPEDLFCAVISSGELARQKIRTYSGSPSVLLIAREGETELLDGLDLVQVQPGDPADLIVLAAVEPFQKSRETYADSLRPYAESKVPVLLVNPDLLLADKGRSGFAPGAVAADYAQMGGPVEVVGKPARTLFAAALETLGNPAPGRVLMIGDSPTHDIAGAAAVGLKTLLVRGGVQAGLEGAPPDFALDRLVWA